MYIQRNNIIRTYIIIFLFILPLSSYASCDGVFGKTTVKHFLERAGLKLERAGLKLERASLKLDRVGLKLDRVGLKLERKDLARDIKRIPLAIAELEGRKQTIRLENKEIFRRLTDKDELPSSYRLEITDNNNRRLENLDQKISKRKLKLEKFELKLEENKLKSEENKLESEETEKSLERIEEEILESN